MLSINNDVWPTAKVTLAVLSIFNFHNVHVEVGSYPAVLGAGALVVFEFVVVSAEFVGPVVEPAAAPLSENLPPP